MRAVGHMFDSMPRELPFRAWGSIFVSFKEKLHPEQLRELTRAGTFDMCHVFHGISSVSADFMSSRGVFH